MIFHELKSICGLLAPEVAVGFLEGLHAGLPAFHKAFAPETHSFEP